MLHRVENEEPKFQVNSLGWLKRDLFGRLENSDQFLFLGFLLFSDISMPNSSKSTFILRRQFCLRCF